MSHVHVYPERDDQHVLKGQKCWCRPEVEFIDPATKLPHPEGKTVVRHNAPSGYRGGWVTSGNVDANGDKV